MIYSARSFIIIEGATRTKILNRVQIVLDNWLKGKQWSVCETKKAFVLFIDCEQDLKIWDWLYHEIGKELTLYGKESII